MSLKEIEEKRMTLLEQIKDLKSQERELIQNILKLHFSEHIEIDWYDNNENYFRILTGDFNFHKMGNVSENLPDWKIYVKAYDNDCVEVEFNRIEG